MVTICCIKSITVKITQINKKQIVMEQDKCNSDGIRDDYILQQSNITGHLSCPEILCLRKSKVMD